MKWVFVRDLEVHSIAFLWLLSEISLAICACWRPFFIAAFVLRRHSAVFVPGPMRMLGALVSNNYVAFCFVAAFLALIHVFVWPLVLLSNDSCVSPDMYLPLSGSVASRCLE